MNSRERKGEHAAVRRRVMRRHRHRGAVTLWTILAGPVLLALLCLVVEITHIFHARVELENALESAALAAVQSWGEGNVTPTLPHRQVGVAYAAANTINGVPVSIGTNYMAGAGVNDNADCSGNLIFGRVTDLNNDGKWEFDAGQRPSCSVGSVLFDTTGQGNLGANNAWGVAFLNPSAAPGYSDLRISQIDIDLQAGGGTYVFDFTSSGTAGGPQLSDNSMDAVQTQGGGTSQDDILGFATPPSSEISFSPTSGKPSSLTITFASGGFGPCDRFRFGAIVREKETGNAQVDGDEIGSGGVRVTVTFVSSSGTPVGTASGTFVDTTDLGCATDATVATDPVCGSLIVNTGANQPNLPCAPSSSATNNGQSWLLLQGSGSSGFYGVRAQASATVPPLCGSFCGLPTSPFSVSADAVAIYQCGGANRPRLIRVLDSNYTCP